MITICVFHPQVILRLSQTCPYLMQAVYRIEGLEKRKKGRKRYRCNHFNLISNY